MNDFIISSQFTLFFAKDKKKVMFAGEQKSFELEIKDDVTLRFFSILYKSGKVAQEENNKELINLLLEKELITAPYINLFENTKFQNQVKLLSAFSSVPSVLQSRIQDKTVLIAGLGGVGTVVLQQLILIGVKKFFLVDYDNVSLSNLNRQVFYQDEDVGKSKLISLKKRLEMSNSSLSITIMEHKVNDAAEFLDALSSQGLKQVDFIVSAADTPPVVIRQTMLKVAQKLKCGISFASVGINQGSFGPTFIDYNLMEKYYNKLESQKKEFEEYEVLITPCSSGSTNTLISSMLFNEIFHLFTGRFVFSLNKKIRFNFQDYSTSIIENYE